MGIEASACAQLLLCFACFVSSGLGLGLVILVLVLKIWSFNLFTSLNLTLLTPLLKDLPSKIGRTFTGALPAATNDWQSARLYPD